MARKSGKNKNTFSCTLISNYFYTIPHHFFIILIEIFSHRVTEDECPENHRTLWDSGTQRRFLYFLSLGLCASVANLLFAFQKRFVLILLFFFTIIFPVFSDYPVIKTLTSGDPLFRQLQEDISAYYRAAYSNGKISAPALKIFSFTPGNEADIFSVCARLNLSYDTIATCNRISNPQYFHDRKTLLVPNQPGLFVPESPSSDLELIILSWRKQNIDKSRQITILADGEKERFFYFPGEKFHPVERAYFLSILFRFPLPKGEITSPFGMRNDPFTGHPAVHNGIDIGAPEGTEVYAVRDGEVIAVGSNNIYGNYLLISHAGGFQSFYGHLSVFLVDLHEKVYSGMVIGKVGTTGRSTGPHLHFEIRKDGDSKDPSTLISH